MTKLNVYAVRHGQTYFNIYNKLQGWSNSPLTQKGIDDAHDAGKRMAQIKFAAAYSSDTTRAEQTAKVILGENQVSAVKVPETQPYFREQFYGSFEGTNMDAAWYSTGAPHGVPTFKAIVDKYSIGKAKDFMKEADPFHHAESDDEYWLRINKGIALIRSNDTLKDGDNVLLISHGNTLLSLMERFGQGKFDLSVRPANGSVTKLIVTDDDVTVDFYNQTD
ncbi:histidine phosphatase family protein [Paucilactobacillus nenjiangensis]|uniref:Histidine phosphatase family protein n=1 Tax=Paucilactobacillus nenjiangensis TaxID=1296540 RepID=A0A5P1WYV5_9LACO|nr:histidine phosphatase family protein [Paucilactobacillus nenjiangensis]QER66840.1 histidine phosphatase family protein [Paucilactobacillus nenjiangensis]